MGIVTNLFMGNALQNAELRPPSFKGLLRWWFRAGGGSLEEEKRIFGWTGRVSRAGLVNLRISKQNTKNSHFSKEFHREEGFVISGSGLNYIGFALDERFKREQKGRRRRQYIEGTFTLEILFHPLASEEDIRKFFATLWLAVNLGNFGSRSRRCFGSLRILHIDPDPPVEIRFGPDLSDPGQWIKQSIEEIRGILNSRPRRDLPFIGNMKIFRVRKENWRNYHSWIKNVQKGRRGKYIVKEWARGKDSQKLLFEKPLDMCDFMGFLMQAYRSYYEPDHTNMYNILVNRNTGSNVVNRVGFGLPLPFFFRSAKKRGTVNLKMGNATARRASPLILKVLSDGKNFEGFFIHMESTFKPGNASVEVNGTKVNYERDIIRDFLQSLESHSLVKRIL